MKSTVFLILSCALILVTSESQDDLDDLLEVICREENGFEIHPDCRFYYLCSNGKPVLMPCPGDTYFNPEKEECDDPDNVPECVGGTRLPPSAPPTRQTQLSTSETPKEETSEFPSISTQAFTEIPSSEEPTSKFTSDNTVSDTSTPVIPASETPVSQITFDNTVSTQIPETSEHTTSGDISTPYPGICPPEGIHRLPFPGSCSMYFFCVNGIATVETCAEGLLFDPTTRQCRKAEEVECEQVPPTTKAPNVCPEEGRYYLPFPGDCTRYIVCAEGDMFFQDCHPGLFFDPLLSKCNFAELVDCEYAIPKCPLEGMHFLPIQGTCKKYVFCVYGTPNYMACGDGLYFDPEKSLCVPESELDCPYSSMSIISSIL